MEDITGFLLIEILEKILGKKTPKWIAIFVFTLLLGFIITVLIGAGFSSLSATGLSGAVFCWVISFLVFILWLYTIYRIIILPKEQ